MSVFDEWYSHTCSVETVGTPDRWGAVPTTPHTGVLCAVEDGTRIVRTSSGAETASTTRLFVALSDAPKFTPGSSVTVEDRQPAQVISVEVVDEGDEDLDGATVNLE